MLGSQIPAAARATLLGRALTVEYSPEPVEREILHRLEKALAVSELVVLLEGCSMREERYFGSYRFAATAWIG